MNGRLRLLVLCVIAPGAAVMLCAAAGAAGGRAKAAAVTLSNERTVTRWAHVVSVQSIFRGPSSSSARVGALHRETEDGFPEVYLLLKAQSGALGQEWVKLRIPGRPNGRVGWVHRDALGTFHLTHRLVVVDRERLLLSVYSSGRLLWSAPVGVGAPATPTPAGHFWIREEFRISDPASGYYPYAFGTADYSTLTEWPRGGVVGIHGPFFAPQEIPGHISHGCIRLGVADDAKLARYVGPGTPLLVR
jgi:lipoprotein-anchoring transpeptidase ErfK/SrfK